MSGAWGSLPPDRITVLKHRQDCPNLTCTGPSTHMVLAVNGHTGYARGPDYRNVDVMGAYTYLPSLDIGLTVKVGAALRAVLVVRTVRFLGGGLAAALSCTNTRPTHQSEEHNPYQTPNGQHNTCMHTYTNAHKVEKETGECQLVLYGESG